MIDTLTLSFSGSEYPSIEDYNKAYSSIRHSLSNLGCLCAMRHPQGSKDAFIKRQWDLLISFYDDHFSLSINLWKYYKGNNIVPFEIFEVSDALKQLSSDLGIRVEKGLLERIDIAWNFEMTRPVGDYIREMLRPFGMEYLHDYTNETLAFRNKTNSQQVSCYDKIKKARKAYKAGNLTSFEEGEFPPNLLRYEFRIKSRLRQVVNWRNTRQDVKGVYLHSTAFLRQLVQFWFKGFCKIEWLSSPNYDQIAGMPMLKEFLIARGIESIGGLSNCYTIIEGVLDEQGKPLSSPTKSKLRKFLKHVVENKRICQQSEISKELRRKIVDQFKLILKHQNSTIFSVEG